MDVYSSEFDQFSNPKPWRFTRVADLDGLNRHIADDLVTRLKASTKTGRAVT